MRTPPSDHLNRFLERRGRWLSENATLTLATLVVFLGITAGFGYALHAIHRKERAAAGDTAAASRGGGLGGAIETCAHAAVDFEPDASAAAIRRALRAAEAVVTYGPDEFGRYQLRLSGGAQGAGVASLRASGVASSVGAYPECPP
jgi:hypothetical protein